MARDWLLPHHEPQEQAPPPAISPVASYLSFWLRFLSTGLHASTNSSCVTLGELLKLSVPHSPHL